MKAGQNRWTLHLTDFNLQQKKMVCFPFLSPPSLDAEILEDSCRKRRPVLPLPLPNNQDVTLI